VTALLLTFLACLGLLIGSFLNVVVWRVPRGESIVRPPSACPACHTRIKARDNVPVVSWLLLRGHCRACACAISSRYPLVEAGTALLFVLVGVRLGATWALAGYLYLAAVAVALALIDLDTHRLPNSIVLPSYGVMGILLGLASWGAGDWSTMLRALIACAAMYAFYFVAMVVYPGGMGFGDVKLAGLLGLSLGWLSWGALVIGWFAAFLLGGTYSVGLLIARRVGRRTAIAFGPWMILGAAVGVGVGSQVWRAYLDLVA
jgi:leader peptidase (prepilin peptidase)/N-methyltransferase